MRIEAAVWREGSAVPVIETLDLEPPRAGEVLVRLHAAGVCHTDVRVAGRPGPRPIVLGHEGAGTVVEAGEGVEDLTPGDPVLMSYSWCGACPACRRRAMAYCFENGRLNFSGLRADGSSPLSKAGERVHGAFFGQSSFATHAVVSAHTVVKAPADLPLERLAPLGCGVQTGAGAVLNALKVQAGASFAVFGVGSVGLSAIMAAVVAGASRIIAVDVNPARLALALQLGATAAIDPRREDPAAAIRDLTGAGADAVLNTTEVPEVYLQGIASLGTLGVFGFVTWPGGELGLNPSALMLRGQSIRGIVQGDSEPPVFIPLLIDLHRRGLLPLERLITAYPFEDIARAFDDSEAGAAIKPVLLMPG